MIDEHDQNLEFAVKIFKTSILIFKDRERYVNGEFRFRKGHCKGNPRKKVKLWAEKEVRNLKRICGNEWSCCSSIKRCSDWIDRRWQER